jgi:hypothetical protein
MLDTASCDRKAKLQYVHTTTEDEGLNRLDNFQGRCCRFSKMLQFEMRRA